MLIFVSRSSFIYEGSVAMAPFDGLLLSSKHVICNLFFNGNYCVMMRSSMWA